MYLFRTVVVLFIVCAPALHCPLSALGVSNMSHEITVFLKGHENKKRKVVRRETKRLSEIVRLRCWIVVNTIPITRITTPWYTILSKLGMQKFTLVMWMYNLRVIIGFANALCCQTHLIEVVIFLWLCILHWMFNTVKIQRP